MAKRRANGEGSIRKRKNGRWEGRYTAGYDRQGKRIVKNVLGKTQAEVKEKLKRALEENVKIDVTKAGQYTVAQWCWLWHENYCKPAVKDTTAEYYHRSIELHVGPRIGAIKLNRLTGRDLQKLYRDLLEDGRLRKEQKDARTGLSSATVRGIHMMLHNTLDRAKKEKLILSNPAEDCIIPKLEKQEMKILRPGDMKAYLAAAEEYNALPMFYLELTSGIRKGELTALLWDDLNVEEGTISVSKQALCRPNGELVVGRPKTKNAIRLISIPQEAVDLLVQEHEKHPDNPCLFPPPKTGEMYHPDSVVNLHKRILKRAGLPHIRFHDLRHHGTAEWRRRENGVKYAGPLRRRVHPPYLHPRHPSGTERSRAEDGSPYEAGDVSKKRTCMSYLTLCGCLNNTYI